MNFTTSGDTRQPFYMEPIPSTSLKLRTSRLVPLLLFYQMKLVNFLMYTPRSRASNLYQSTISAAKYMLIVY